MDKLIFDKSDHSYRIGNKRLLSVTECLQILDDRWKVDPFYLQRGKMIHLATELLDRDELDESSVDERILPYFEAYKKFKNNIKFTPHIIEKPFFHPQYKYAGKPDRIAAINDSPELIDIKSGAKSRIDELQGAAYWELCRTNGIIVRKVFDLYLKDDGNYSLIEVERPRLLLPIFLAALKITQWKDGLI